MAPRKNTWGGSIDKPFSCWANASGPGGPSSKGIRRSMVILLHSRVQHHRLSVGHADLTGTHCTRAPHRVAPQKHSCHSIPRNSCCPGRAPDPRLQLPPTLPRWVRVHMELTSVLSNFLSFSTGSGSQPGILCMSLFIRTNIVSSTQRTLKT